MGKKNHSLHEHTMEFGYEMAGGIERLVKNVRREAFMEAVDIVANRPSVGEFSPPTKKILIDIMDALREKAKE